jgi:hypothetical protein
MPSRPLHPGDDVISLISITNTVSDRLLGVVKGKGHGMESQRLTFSFGEENDPFRVAAVDRRNVLAAVAGAIPACLKEEGLIVAPGTNGAGACFIKNKELVRPAQNPRPNGASTDSQVPRPA